MGKPLRKEALQQQEIRAQMTMRESSNSRSYQQSSRHLYMLSSAWHASWAARTSQHSRGSMLCALPSTQSWLPSWVAQMVFFEQFADITW